MLKLRNFLEDFRDEPRYGRCGNNSSVVLCGFLVSSFVRTIQTSGGILNALWDDSSFL